MKKLAILKIIFLSVAFEGTILSSSEPSLIIKNISDDQGTQNNSLSIIPEMYSKEHKRIEENLELIFFSEKTPDDDVSEIGPAKKIPTTYRVDNRKEPLYFYTSRLYEEDLAYISFEFTGNRPTELGFVDYQINPAWFEPLWPTVEKLTLSNFGQSDPRNRSEIKTRPKFSFNLTGRCPNLKELKIIKTNINKIILLPESKNITLTVESSHLQNTFNLSDSIEKLELMSCSSDFSVLTIPQSVQILTIHNCEDLKALEIEKENQIKELSVQNCKNLLINLALFPNLEKIEITNTSLSNIEHCSTSLQNLTLRDVSIDNIGLNLAHLTNLKHILIQNERELGNLSKLEGILFPSNLNVNRLKITNLQSLIEITNLPLCSDRSYIKKCPLLKLQNLHNLIKNPEEPFHDQTHNVKFFDTCTSIVAQYNTNRDKIKQSQEAPHPRVPVIQPVPQSQNKFPHKIQQETHPKIQQQKIFKIFTAATVVSLLLSGLILYRQKISSLLKQLYKNFSVPRS